ncbi:MAG: nuclear transport factor 2 family protein [Deltaproteobacteria bacterium]|nr:nuclear transport factor 2 family protein [Deltaproteobacteria bacterium]
MRAVAIGLVFAIGCGGASAPAPKAPKEDAVDERKAEKGAKDLVGEIYETIGAGDTDGLMSLLADPLIVFGPRRTDAMGTRADALVALKAQIDPKAKKKPAVRSGSLEVVASPGGHSAWAIDVLDVGGQPMALTAVLTNADDIWQVHAAALAETPPMKSIRAELKKDAIVPPGLTGVAKLDAGAQGAVDKFKKGLADQDVWGTDLASHSDAIVIGPATGDITRGKSDIKKMWKKRMKANTRATAAGDFTAEVTPDGELAWVSAAVVQFADDDDPLPLRDFAVYEKAGGDWKLIALQESLALDEPGAGVTYRKTQPPASAKPADEPKKEAPPPDKPKKKKKKKKKHTDDDDG